jgi:hypothetical protein
MWTFIIIILIAALLVWDRSKRLDPKYQGTPKEIGFTFSLEITAIVIGMLAVLGFVTYAVLSLLSR